MIAFALSAILGTSPVVLTEPLSPPPLTAAEDPSPPLEHSAGLIQPAPKPRPGFSGWHVAGIWGGATTGGTLGAFTYALAAVATTARSPATGAQFNCSGSACAISYFAGLGLGMMAGGYLGYRLGELALDGRLWARILVIALDVVGLPITAFCSLGAVAFSGNFPGGD
jgi:hypothetical protein